MKLSIVIPTLGRMQQVDDLLSSIERYAVELDLEIIIVDQNSDDRLCKFVERHAQLNVRRVRVDFKGLSRARNYGSRLARGQYIHFPDDDSEYVEGSLAHAIAFLDTHQDYAAVSGKVVDREGHGTATHWAKQEQDINPGNLYGCFVEAALVYRHDAFERFPDDVSLGVGTFHGAEEGADQVYRMLRAGEKIRYIPTITFYHPLKVLNKCGASEIRRIFSYRCGFALFCKKNGLWKMYAKRLVLVTGYMIFLFVTRSKKWRYYASEWCGLLSGLIVPPAE